MILTAAEMPSLPQWLKGSFCSESFAQVFNCSLAGTLHSNEKREIKLHLWFLLPTCHCIYNNWGFLVLIVPGAGIETLSLDLCCYSFFSKQLRVKELILRRTSQMNPVSRYSVCLLSVLICTHFLPLLFSLSP